ncbi:MAG: 16S rRNA (guanine(966)-N(2))-methyltransferase RsmD [Lachnospiraceae bacterium]|nr:16S rRNA (guanine(966)-N(2))-methyltransferase RsmD [Lachnospiraceae bacterium]
MRVIAGTARSLPLKAPEGMGTRPTTDRIKETLFNILQNNVPGSVFVDLYSGSGAIGIEAISRGAKKAYFIENGAAPLQCIHQNLAFTKFTDRAIVIKQDAVAALSQIHEKRVDIIFMDAPYGQGEDERVLRALAAMPFVDEDTLILVEEDKHRDFAFAASLGFEISREKTYKTNKHVFLHKSNA